MKLRTPTRDLIAVEFADAVASGDNDRAEGWLATAVWVERRERRRGLLSRALDRLVTSGRVTQTGTVDA